MKKAFEGRRICFENAFAQTAHRPPAFCKITGIVALIQLVEGVATIAIFIRTMRRRSTQHPCEIIVSLDALILLFVKPYPMRGITVIAYLFSAAWILCLIHSTSALTGIFERKAIKIPMLRNLVLLSSHLPSHLIFSMIGELSASIDVACKVTQSVTGALCSAGK